MASCLAGVAVTLMALKLVVWLTIARAFASAPLNGVFATAASLMLWTYARAACADAGPVNFALDGRVRSAEEGGDEHEELKAEQGYCERCDRPKPARVHHCSTCRRCVYRMDHHCPWTSNCVGWSNKKYFLLFLLYTSVSCLAFCAMVTPLVFSSDPELKRVRHAHKTLLQLGWTLSLAIGLVLAGYFMFHIYLVRQGKTTLEYITGKPGEFERVPFWRHVRVYFGSNALLWLVPVAPRLDARIRGRRHERESRQLMI